MPVIVDPHVVFESVCDMSYEQREELLKLLVIREPDLADGLLCSLGSKYQRYLERVQEAV
jgi:hypothetical protein